MLQTVFLQFASIGGVVLLTSFQNNKKYSHYCCIFPKHRCDRVIYLQNLIVRRSNWQASFGAKPLHEITLPKVGTDQPLIFRSFSQLRKLGTTFSLRMFCGYGPWPALKQDAKPTTFQSSCGRKLVQTLPLFLSITSASFCSWFIIWFY